MLSPKFGRRNQQQNVPVSDPYNSNLTLNNSNTYGRQQQYSKTQLHQVTEPQISVSQANLNQKNESTGFLSSLGTLGRKKKQQEGKYNSLIFNKVKPASFYPFFLKFLLIKPL